MAKTANPNWCTLEYYKGVNSISATVVPDVVGMLSWRDYRIKGSWSRAPWEREVGSHTRALLCGYVGLPGPPGWRSHKESACQRRRRERGGFDPRSRKRQPTPVSLPGEVHGQRSLVGYGPRACKSQV